MIIITGWGGCFRRFLIVVIVKNAPCKMKSFISLLRYSSGAAIEKKNIMRAAQQVRFPCKLPVQ